MSLADALLLRAQSSNSVLFELSSSRQGTSNGGLAAFLAKSRNTSTTDGNKSPAQAQIASFHPQKTLPPVDYASQATTQLVRSVRMILASNSSDSPAPASRPSLQSLYRNTLTLVNYSSQESLHDLYDTVKIEIERAAGNYAKSLHSSASNNESLASSISWLTQLQSIWSNWCDNLALVRDVLLPLDRFFLQNTSTATASAHLSQTENSHSAHALLPIWDLGLDIFGHRVLKDATLSNTILTRIVAAVDGERTESVSYRELHTFIADMFRQLKAEKMLDDAIVASTAAFYQVESTASIASLPPTDYVEYADRRIMQEQQRSQWCLLTDQGRSDNVAAARKELVTQHADKILAGLPDLITAKELQGLGKIYRLIKSIKRLTDLRKVFADYIKTHGASIVNDRERDEDMIDRLLEFKSFIDAIVSTGFQSDNDFVNAQKDSFEVFVNKRENKPAELIAKFLDAKLRSGNKTMTDQELEHNLDEALILFRYTHAKDMFEEFYKRHFAKRLLLNRSASSDAERSMLLKLKEECGPEFTAKLETMIKDVDVSKDLMDEYERFAAKQRKEGEGFDLSVSVLTQAHWPTYPDIQIVLPAELSMAAELFEAFYKKRNSGRRLHWQHSLGTLSITTQFGKAGVKELQVSTFQAVVLMLFNNLTPGEKLGYIDIRTQTGLNDDELKRTLQSLACGQIPTRVLRKVPQGKEVNDEDEFMFNDNFKNERHRIRINQIQMKETAAEQKSTEQRVFLDRELILQAAAVRVLKARKTIKHSELITEVVDQIKSRFSVDVSEIKKVFEILIEKEYMERVEGQRGMYRYLA